MGGACSSPCASPTGEGNVTAHQRGSLQSHLWNSKQGGGPGENGSSVGLRLTAQQAGSAVSLRLW